jgi:hypothetical protein
MNTRNERAPVVNFDHQALALQKSQGFAQGCLAYLELACNARLYDPLARNQFPAEDRVAKKIDDSVALGRRRECFEFHFIDYR